MRAQSLLTFCYRRSGLLFRQSFNVLWLLKVPQNNQEREYCLVRVALPLTGISACMAHLRQCLLLAPVAVPYLLGGYEEIRQKLLRCLLDLSVDLYWQSDCRDQPG